MEFPTEFFSLSAWNPERWSKDEISDNPALAERESGPANAPEIADIISKYTKYNGLAKPELLEPDTFDLFTTRRQNRVIAGWNSITRKAEEIYTQPPGERGRTPSRTGALPNKGLAVVNDLYITVEESAVCRSRPCSANDLAARARAFLGDTRLCRLLNRTLALGKWIT